MYKPEKLRAAVLTHIGFSLRNYFLLEPLPPEMLEQLRKLDGQTATEQTS